MQEDERGRQRPVKLGMAPVQRDDTEYEFDIVLDIGRDHVATASKDTTFLDKYGEVITPDLGVKLRDWLNENGGPSSEAEKILCSVCGRPILATRRSSALEVAQITSEETGQVMCVGCYKIWKKDMEANRHEGN